MVGVVGEGGCVVGLPEEKVGIVELYPFVCLIGLAAVLIISCISFSPPPLVCIA